jgi:F-type H+-transporting ATPase subunit epsilon
VIVPAFRGQLGILPGHAPLVSTLAAGTLKVRLKGETKMKAAAISWGYLEVNPSGVVVLAETADWPEELDKNQVEENLKIASRRLDEAGLEPIEKVQALRDVEREKARLELLK